MNFAAARNLYNSLPSTARINATLANMSECPVAVDHADFGRVVFTTSAVSAINLDNLFSARWDGASVETAVMSAFIAATETADASADVLTFTVNFGRAGRATLNASMTNDGIRIDG